MAQQEISGNSGYLALKRETTVGTAVTPDTFIPLYDESLSTDNQLDTNSVVFGNKAARLLVTPGVRAHSGDFTVLAEPTTTGALYDMLLTQGTPTTADNVTTTPYTAEFTNPASYTVDISSGNQVFRFAGFQASEIDPDFQTNEMHWKVTGSALKSFLGAEVDSVSTDTVTLKAPVNYPNPTECLVTGDLVSLVPADGSDRQNFTIASLTTTSVTLDSAPTGISAGDELILRPATPTFPTQLTPFLWSRTEFHFGADAATALTNAHTPLESGSTWTLTHPFNNDSGEPRSGSFDPASLARGKSVDATFKLNRFFYDPDEVRNYTGIKKTALVIRCFAGTSSEFRLTFNNLTLSAGGDKPAISADNTEYYELEYMPAYDITDGQMLDAKVITPSA